MTWEQQWHRPSVLPSFSPTYTPQTETSHCFFRWHQRSLLQVSRQTGRHNVTDVNFNSLQSQLFSRKDCRFFCPPPKTFDFSTKLVTKIHFYPVFFPSKMILLCSLKQNHQTVHQITAARSGKHPPLTEINITFWSITTHLNHFQKSYFFQQQLLVLKRMIFSSLQMFGSAYWQNIIRKLSVHPDLGAQRALLVTHNCTPTDRCISVCCKGSDHFSTSEARGSNKIPVTLQPG